MEKDGYGDHLEDLGVDGM